MNPSPDLAEFIEAVAADSGLLRVLGEEKSADTFAAACATFARERGLSVTAGEVCDLLRARTVLWYQRHVL